jgi:FAD/FMN-containing dehydrogenase
VNALRALADGFAGEVIVPGDPGYDSARRVWNAMVDRRPAAIVRPTGPEDVLTAIRVAREADVVIAVRGGGHSIAGLSTCDDGIVIDLSRMGGVRVDPATWTARCGGGALLAELDDAAQAVGLVCPVGVVSHTGLAGLTLGGGMGRLQRKHGLTIDNLRAVEVATADGRLVRASADEHPELFWGLRGAGANFGVATSFEFGLHPLEGVVTQGSVTHPLERAVELGALFRQIAVEGPNELMATFNMSLAPPAADFPPEVAGRPIVELTVVHSGTAQEAERDLGDLRRFGPPVVDTIAAKRYVDVQHMSDQPMAWGRRFYMKSAFLLALPDEVVAVAVEHASRIPEGCEGSISTWAWGGAIAAVPEDATAFTGRDAAFWIAAEAAWEDPALDEASRGWARSFIADVTPFAVGGRYVNDVAEPGEDIAAIYGRAKQERLVALKRAWDPDNAFRLNLNVRP